MGKKVLVFTAATGGGHLQAASAINEYFTDNGYSVEVVDGLRAASRPVNKVVVGSYLFMARRTPLVFGGLYKWSGTDTGVSRLLRKINSALGKKLFLKINEVNPDLIITTHPFITEMVSSIKKSGLISTPVMCVVTDYGPHAAWLGSHVDAFITATEDMTPDVEALGVPAEKIYACGIPVHKAFFSDIDKNEILDELGFSTDKTTVLLMAGSFGVESVMTFYKSLIKSTQNMQIIIITGKNEHLFKSFEKELEYCDIPHKLLFFTKEVHKYMRAADLLITKPGGLTVSEALASNLPLAVFDAIPGQEEDNADFLVRHGMGIKLGKHMEEADCVSKLINDKERLNKMKEACIAFDSSSTLPKMEKLADEMMSLGNRGAGE